MNHWPEVGDQVILVSDTENCTLEGIVHSVGDNGHGLTVATVVLPNGDRWNAVREGMELRLPDRSSPADVEAWLVE